MASIHQEIPVDVSADQAWAALRQVGQADTLFAPVLNGCQLDGDNRIVKFANGMVLHERILDVDDRRRRVAYAAVDGPGMTYHHASMQIIEAGAGRSVFVWVTDFLPEDVRANLAQLIEQGTAALKRNLEAPQSSETR
jgi:Polyketide cyclase / dehydrase and lipid transport